MFQGGAVENLAVAQLPLHVAHDALPQRAHPGQVVRERLVHDAKDALPVCARHGRRLPFATLASLPVPPRYMVLPPAQVDQSYPPVGHPSDRLAVGHEQQERPVVHDDLDSALVVLDA